MSDIYVNVLKLVLTHLSRFSDRASKAQVFVVIIYLRRASKGSQTRNVKFIPTFGIEWSYGQGIMIHDDTLLFKTVFYWFINK